MQTLQRLSIYVSSWLITIIFLMPAVVSAGTGFYSVDKTIRAGMLVSLTKNTGVVEAATEQNASSLVGVVGSSESDFGILPDQISVQTDGTVNVLVSTIGGDIQVGDHIGPTSLVGLGGKTTKDGWIVGTAQANLDSKSKGAVATSIHDSKGQKHDIYTATIPVIVKVTYSGSPAKPTGNPDALPQRLQSLADSVAGKHASVVAVVLGFLLLLLGFILAARIIGVTAKTSIEAIARQPLAKHEIVLRMLQSFALAIGFVIGSVVGAFILIRVL